MKICLSWTNRSCDSYSTRGGRSEGFHHGNSGRGGSNRGGYTSNDK
jgi:hypothetical protein